MTSALEDALRRYQAGDYDGVIADHGLLAQEPDCPQALLVVLAQCFGRTGQPLRAARHFRRAAETPGRDNALFMMRAGELFLANLAINEAYQAGIAARDLAPENPATHRFYYRALRHTCLFDEIAEENAALESRLRAGEAFALESEDAFTHLSWCDDDALTAMLTGVPKASRSVEAMDRSALPGSRNATIRIGYLAESFNPERAPMRFLAPVLALHDRQRFDISLLSVERQDEAQYPQIWPVHHLGGLNDNNASQTVRALNLDILVDLAGHAPTARPALVNLGLAPLQLSYWSHPAPSAGIDYDYVLGDRISLPDGAQEPFREGICRLPEWTLPAQRPAPPPAVRSRASLGLPEDAVLLAFTHHKHKLSPQAFTLLLNVLRQTDNTIAMLAIANRFSRDNILAATVEAGVDPERIHFSNALTPEDRRARLATADLALDAAPYNSPMDMLNALSLGIPVVTLRGQSFASRMSASLLINLGLGSLVTDTPDAYVRRAAQLAASAEARAEASLEITRNLQTSPVLDAARFTQHLESAFLMMASRARKGLPPTSFDTPRLETPETQWTEPT